MQGVCRKKPKAPERKGEADALEWGASLNQCGRKEEIRKICWLKARMWGLAAGGKAGDMERDSLLIEEAYDHNIAVLQEEIEQNSQKRKIDGMVALLSKVRYQSCCLSRDMDDYCFLEAEYGAVYLFSYSWQDIDGCLKDRSWKKTDFCDKCEKSQKRCWDFESFGVIGFVCGLSKEARRRRCPNETLRVRKRLCRAYRGWHSQAEAAKRRDIHEVTWKQLLQKEKIQASGNGKVTPSSQKNRKENCTGDEILAFLANQWGSEETDIKTSMCGTAEPRQNGAFAKGNGNSRVIIIRWHGRKKGEREKYSFLLSWTGVLRETIGTLQPTGMCITG